MDRMVREDLRKELCAMAAEDLRVREELAADGSLYGGGYHPRMQQIHDEHAARLERILEDVGWPGESLVGADGASSAWLILQHAIGHPELQRRGLAELKRLVGEGEVNPVEVAMLEDRVRCFEDRPQLYGTQFDWDEAGAMSPLPVDDPEAVDERRAAVGLPPLDVETQRRRDDVSRTNERAPADWREYRARLEDWLRRTGWR